MKITLGQKSGHCMNCKRQMTWLSRICVYCGARVQGWAHESQCKKNPKNRRGVSLDGDVWTYVYHRHDSPFCPDCGQSLSSVAPESEEG